MVQQERKAVNGARQIPPAQQYSAAVQFIGEAAKEAVNAAPTSVEIYSHRGQWYCRVRCGDKTTRPMGPYTLRQAEQIQYARRSLIAESGTARIMFE